MGVGRKPKPTHLKALAGNPGHRPLNENEPQPDALGASTEPPSHLSGEAKTEWRRLLPMLVRANMITEVDMAAFALYCQAFGRYVEAESYVAKQGAILIAPSGFPIMNPYLFVSNKAFDQMARLMVEFGVTPSSRSRVSTAAPKKKESRFLALVGGKGK